MARDCPGETSSSPSTAVTGGLLSATVRVARTSGRSLLLRAPLVTTWQSDPEFEDKVRLIHQWWQAYGKGTVGTAGPTSG